MGCVCVGAGGSCPYRGSAPAFCCARVKSVVRGNCRNRKNRFSWDGQEQRWWWASSEQQSPGLRRKRYLQGLCRSRSWRINQQQQQKNAVQEDSHQIRSHQVCGRPAALNRNVGGEDSVEGEWPWQVSVRKLDKHVCGGALITHNWIVTAAHCFQPDSNPSQFNVVLGANKLENSGPHRQSIGVAEIFRNPWYAGEATSGDIALVRLVHSVRFNNYILPICVPAANVDFPSGKKCWVTGWGDISEGQDLPAPKKLQKLQVPIIDTETCRRLYNIDMGQSLPRKPIQDDMMCAGYAEGMKDTCKGDSGGPLMCKMNQEWLLAGIVSWGEGCAEKNRPGVYIRLTSYQNWIHSIIPNLEFIQTRMGQNKAKTQNQANGRRQAFFSFALLLVLVWTLTHILV
ncbi:serine protease 27-like [Hemicordylus capensis]|uniref:serine protease 27-like n=1 Tax=Hemicordylus capensis TaxID=884348 RepID=UPI0023043033|nr:serine protease 27-like [Hemicordylus capensis]